MIKRGMAAALAALTVFCALFTGCRKETGWAEPYDGSAVSYPASVYYANYGKICFLYDRTRDVIENIEDENTVSISDIDGGTYSVLVTYKEGRTDLDDTWQTLLASMTSSGFETLSEPLATEAFGTRDCRTVRMLGEDGSAARAWFGNTESGSFEVYYLLSAQAVKEQADYMLEMVETITFGQFTDNDTVFVGDVS